MTMRKPYKYVLQCFLYIMDTRKKKLSLLVGKTKLILIGNIEYRPIYCTESSPPHELEDGDPITIVRHIYLVPWTNCTSQIFSVSETSSSPLRKHHVHWLPFNFLSVPRGCRAQNSGDFWTMVRADLEELFSDEHQGKENWLTLFREWILPIWVMSDLIM